MHGDERITFSRDCEVIQVPAGSRMVLHAGTGGSIHQALGGTYTVVTDEGFMVRVQNQDVDAIGKDLDSTIQQLASAQPQSAEEVEGLVWDQLRTCFDPEIPVNIADLGLVYACAVTVRDGGGYRVHIEMTLTAPGCGMGDVLKAEVESKLPTIPGITETDVELVFDPPWDFSMIPDAAKLTLGMM
ncbi:MAG: putative Fe-S cluster assembly protein SufT [Chloroflexi bacterium]|nr:putative Fe-S cluster assembly protein SufT [Chloroflexota bacterium]